MVKNMLKQNLKYIVFILSLIIGVLLFFIIQKNLEQNIKNIYISELIVEKGEERYEIFYNEQNNKTYLKNLTDEFVIYEFKREPKARMSLLNIDTIEGLNIIQNIEPYIDYTYNVKYEDSCKYLKYLLNEGYNIEMSVYNSQYMEFFLLKDEKYKRVVIFPDSLMVCDMLEGSILPSIESYFSRYEKMINSKSLGGIEDAE